jgi:hypothetical protein
MNDGGMDFSNDGGINWQNRSNGLETNMFYDLSLSQSDPQFYGGGLQDNGTVVTTEGKPDKFFELTGGDGGWLVIDPSDSLHLFSSAQGMRIFRFRSSDLWTDVSPPENQFDMWMVFIAMDPANSKLLFTGSRRVWRTKNDGDTWTAVSDNLDGSDITCIDIARADSKRIYVGTENGGIFRSSDGGNTWSGNLASAILPGRTITRIQSVADDADVVYATVANFDSSHVFRSTDGGETWQDVDQGDLPNVPHHVVVIPLGDANTIFVGNDAGVFVSTDGAATWRNLTRNLPNVMVVDLVLHEPSGTLFAATYGRSIWQIDVSDIV